MQYIDFHSHVFPEEIAGKIIHQLESYYGYPWNGTGLCEDLLASMKSGGVQKSVIFSCATKPEQVTKINNYLASFIHQYDQAFLPFGTMHPALTDFKLELKRMKQLGLRGIKIHPDFQQIAIDSPGMMRIYEEVGDTMPLLFHVGDRKTDYSAPSRLARVLDQMPYLRVIAAHFGGYGCWEEGQKHLIGRKLWIDISSSIQEIGSKKARELVLEHGVERTLFASDYPAVRHDQAVRDAMSLGLSDEENEMIFHKNAEKLLGL